MNDAEMSKHICYDAEFPEDQVGCSCELGRDHSEADCDLSGHS